MKRSDMFEVLQRHVRTVLEGAEGREIRETDSLVSDFGADSLEIVEVVSRTMGDLRIKVPRTQLSQARSIGQLLDLLERAAAPVS